MANYSSQIPACNPPPPVPAKPTELTTYTSDGRKATFRWNAVPTATKYYVRMDNNQDGLAWEWKRPQYCSTNTTNPFLGHQYDRCIEDYTTTQVTLDVEPGKNHNFWVHAGDNRGYNGGIGEATFTSITCNAPSPIPSPSPSRSPLPSPSTFNTNLDINSDNSINSLDILEIIKYIGRRATDQNVNTKADVDKNGTINTLDIINFLKPWK